MLLTRIISGVILAPLFLGVVYLGFPWFDLTIAAAAGIMAAEFTKMDGERGTKRRLMIAAACVLAVAAMTHFGFTAAVLVVILASLCVIAADIVAGRRGLSLIHIAVDYIAVPAIAMIYVRTFGDRQSLFWLLAIVWGADTGAYACGRIIGGPKLAPAISPKKTWSGAVGGLVSGVGASTAVLWAYGATIGPKPLIVALVAAVATEAGDLLESGLKRWYEVKDSGTLIPGHGGLLDRFDGLWVAAPVVALFCWIFGGGVHQW